MVVERVSLRPALELKIESFVSDVAGELNNALCIRI